MSSPPRTQPDEARAWALLLALARRVGQGRPLAGDIGVRLTDDGALEEGERAAWIKASPAATRGWLPCAGVALGPDVERLFDLYMPLCVGPGAATLTIGHLAQTLDGRIAVVSGESKFISAKEDQLHTHRLRALCDVVLVGRHTVRDDDPQLTTRLCDGPSPVRAIVDPQRRLATDRRVFQDGGSATLLLCAPEAARGNGRHGHAEVVAVDPAGDRLSVSAILAELHRRGLRRVFVEGGGVTISRFLEARALSRFHVAVAPLILGSGIPAVTLPTVPALSKALSVGFRSFALGPDILFDGIPRY